MKSLKTYFTYTRPQRRGILSLFVLIALLQLSYYCIDTKIPDKSLPEKQKWLSLQREIDALSKQKADFAPKVYPFNPNFITDAKGYRLGMSVAEIDRLLAFRSQNKYVNSAEEFQAVTQISDSLLGVISPYFKFPDWVKNRKSFKDYRKFPAKKEKIAVKDINAALPEDLIKIYGIGPALSERILKMRETLGGFVSMKQMEDVWGLSPEVVAELDKYFKVLSPPKITKIAINDASMKTLGQFPYFRYPLSKAIVTWRSMNGKINSAADLVKIDNFPVEKVDIIAVYLEF